MYHTTAPFNITVDGVTYLADGNLKSTEPPKLSRVVDREAYKLIYADPAFVFRPMFEVGLVGTKFRVYYGFFNTLAITIGGALPGQPLLQPADIPLVYKGLIDSHGYTVSEDDEVDAIIEGSSPVANLDAKKVITTSKDYLRQIGMTSDTSFDQVYDGSKSIDLIWGKY
jgi:hypothetical protein